MFQRYATGSIGASNRLNYWNSLVSTMFPGMTVDGPQAINASWTGCHLGDFRASLACSERASVRRRVGGGADPASEGRGLIHFQSQGFSATEQCGRQAALFSGDLTFCAPDEPYGIEISDRNAMFVIDFPWAALQDFGGKPGLILRHQTPAMGVLHSFVASLFAQSWQVAPAEEESAALGDVLHRLLVNALTTQSSQSVEAGLKERLLGFVEDNLGNGSLRCGSIALGLGVAKREVQVVFAEMATTASGYINNRRLALAAHRLRTGLRDASLTDLAFELGFSDAAHFSRRFRERFGETPSAYARQFA